MARIYMDSDNQVHVSERIRERLPNPLDQQKMVTMIKKLLTVEAPAAAVGEYQWHIDVETIGRIILRGHTVRTVYSFNENFPNSPKYKLVGGRLVLA